MSLPKAKEKKIIRKDFDEAAKEVNKTLEEQRRYLRERKLENGNNIPTNVNIFS